MAEIASFTGGKRCEECGEQIAPRRVRLNPDTKTCTVCEQEWELQQRKILNRTPGNAVVIIRR